MLSGAQLAALERRQRGLRYRRQVIDGMIAGLEDQMRPRS